MVRKFKLTVLTVMDMRNSIKFITFALLIIHVDAIWSKKKSSLRMVAVIKMIVNQRVNDFYKTILNIVIKGINLSLIWLSIYKFIFKSYIKKYFLFYVNFPLRSISYNFYNLNRLFKYFLAYYFYVTFTILTIF